jgi:hypothetical protein
MSALIYGEQNTILDLRMSLEAHLEKYLGKFENGRIAIAVEPPQTPKPGGGLHCFIGRIPELLQPGLGCWVVTLRQYSQTDAELTKLDLAVRKIKRAYPMHRCSVLPFNELSFPQVTFRLLFNVHAYN